MENTMINEAKHEPHELLNHLLQPTNSIGFTFLCMEIAEQEIAAAKQCHPLLAAQIHDAFRCLCPTDPLRGLDEAVYRHHCRELLERIVIGQDLSRGTAGECIAALSGASLASPPDRAAVLLYWSLFEQIFPYEAKRIRDEAGAPVSDDYDRVCMQELESDLRRKLRSTRNVG